MTAYATCDQCGFAFCTHSEHPVAPDHDNPHTGAHCPGSNHEAQMGVPS